MNVLPTILKAYFVLTRSKFQLPSVASMLAGTLFSLYSSNLLVPDMRLLTAAILTTGPFVAGGALVLNQVFDYQYDKESAKKNLPIASGLVNRRAAAVFSVVLLFLGEVTSIMIGVQTAVVTINAILLSIAYSTPPLRFKARPFVDSISNGLCYGIFPTLVGWTVVSSISAKAVTMCFPLFLLFTGSHILLAIPDSKDDSKSGIVTTSVAIGQRNAVITGSLLWLMAILVLTTYTVVRLFPYESLAVIPVIVIGLAKLLRSDPSNLEQTFGQLKLLSAVMGLIFIGVFVIAILC